MTNCALGTSQADQAQMSSFDLENGKGWGSSADRNEALHPSPRHQISDSRPKLIQRSVTPKKAIARNRDSVLNGCCFLDKQAPSRPLPSFADHRSHSVVEDYSIGYPQLAALINSHGGLLIARKYGYL